MAVPFSIMQNIMSSNQENNQLDSLRPQSARKRKVPSSLMDHEALRPAATSSFTPQVSPVCSDEDDCRDDDSFVSAVSRNSTNSFRFDAPNNFDDKPFEINFVTPTPQLRPSRKWSSCPELSSRKPSRRSVCTELSFSDDNDIALQIEAMAAQVETAFEGRHLKKSKRAHSYEHLPEYTSIKKSSSVQAKKNVTGITRLSPDPFQLIKKRSPKTHQPAHDMPDMAPVLDCSNDSLASFESFSMRSMKPSQMRNEEWSSRTPTKAPSALLQRMEQRFGESFSAPPPSKVSTASVQHMMTSLRGLVL